MRAPWRAVVIAAAILSVTLAVSAQQCPAPNNPVLLWVGQSSGCTSLNQVPCALGETINFNVTTSDGFPFPACTTYLWDFGDGATSTLASPSHVFVANGTFSVFVRVTGGNEVAFAGKQVVVTTILPTIERFSASATAIGRGQTVILSWSTKNAATVRIDPINVSLDALTTSYSFAPSVTRTYTLTAFGAAGFRLSLPVTVVVSDTRRRAVKR